MRVAIDAHAIGARTGGNETYVRALLAALRDHAHGIEPIALQTQASIDRGETVPGIETVPIPFAGTPLRALLGVASATKKARADLLHAQYFVPPRCPVPSVVSVHDIAWRVCPETLPKLLRLRLEMTIRGSMRRARRIVTLTNAVKNEIVEHYEIPADSIDVVAPYPDAIFVEPVTEEALQDIRRKHNLPTDFVLYCGAMQPRKNLVRLARTIANTSDAPTLVIAGPRVWRAKETHRELQRVGLGDRLRLLDYVPREDLPRLMRAATAFAYIPHYEGFGLPVIEALACGTPVLASDIPSLREVAGEASHFCDPNDDAAVQEALATLLEDTEIQTLLKHDGPQQASRFTPQSMAKAAAEAYRRALT